MGDLVILQILLNNTGTVTKIQGNQGLTQWYRRTSVLNGLGGRMEEWYATTTQPVSNPAIYITETLSGITVATQEFAIAGYDFDAPFDPNPHVPSNATGSANTIFATISTSHPQDLLLGFEYGGGGTISAGQGFTGICLNVASCQFKGISPSAAEYAIVSSVESSFNVSMTQTAGASWGIIADAVKASSPAITLISPNHGVVGSPITIAGISFNDTIDLEFCGTSQPTFTVVNDTMITTVAPQLPNPPDTQTCDVAVTTREGNSAIISADRFSLLPNVVSIYPSSGGVGTVVTLKGTSFAGATSVSICGVSQPRITVTNDTQIVTTVPGIGLTSSTKCSVSVTSPNGASGSEANMFTFLPQTEDAPAPAPPLLSGRTLFIIALTLVAVALLFGSRVIQKRESAEDSQRATPT
ncbi:MAG TPA: IPT/TIG domain-containing protein [Candidatus Angelobacter sp.]|nr:IPT/TIG domain-containing protein [Candidatus Angelobacter sp.]